MFSVHNKTLIITGGGSGIGKAISKLFADAGAIVHLIEKDRTAAEKVVGEIKQKGGTAYVHACDISVHQSVQETVKKIADVDILVNNAGIAHVGTVEQTAPEDFNRLFEVNVKGTYNCLHAVLPIMKEKRSGVVINLSSVAAQVGIKERFAYSMTKGAVHAMTLSVAKDYLQFGIRVNSISPARVHTPFVDGFIQKNYAGKEKAIFQQLSESQPIGRMGTPEEVAWLALFLASQSAGFITGCDYPIDGGFLKLNS